MVDRPKYRVCAIQQGVPREKGIFDDFAAAKEFADRCDYW